MSTQIGNGSSYDFNCLPGILPQEIRDSLKRAGHKLGNPSPMTTTFKPRKGWKAVIRGDHAVMYDPAGHARYEYYPEAKVARVGMDENWRYVPRSEAYTHPWLEVIPRYEPQRFSLTRFQAFDRKLGQPYGGLHETMEGVISELNENKPGWQYGEHWEDEVPEKWWHRLIFWRRNRDDNTSNMERRLQAGDDHHIPGAMTVHHGSEVTPD